MEYFVGLALIAVFFGLNYWLEWGLIVASYALLVSFWGSAHAFLGVIFVVGTLPFFLFILADIGLLMFFMDDEREKGGPSALVVLGTLLLFQFFGDFQIFNFAYEHFGKFVLFAVIYVALGIPWVLVKAFIISGKHTEKGYASVLETFLSRTGKQEKDLATDVALQKEWATTVESYDHTLRWNPLYNKKRISVWLFHWPWSLLSTLLNDFIRELYNIIYRQIEVTLKKIADYQFRSQVKYLPPKACPPVSPSPLATSETGKVGPIFSEKS